MTGLVSSRPASLTFISSFKGSSQFSVHSSQLPRVQELARDFGLSKNYSGRPDCEPPAGCEVRLPAPIEPLRHIHGIGRPQFRPAGLSSNPIPPLPTSWRFYPSGTFRRGIRL